MSAANSKSHIAGRRAELMAELFLQEFEPLFLSRPTSKEASFDLLAGFRNQTGGTNIFTVEVQHTKQGSEKFATVSRNVFKQIATSNVPGLLIVADAKRNTLYYGWLNQESGNSTGQSVKVPLIKIDQSARATLRREFRKGDHAVKAAG